MSKRVNPSVNAISTVVVVLITLILIGMNVLPMLRKKSASLEMRPHRKGPKIVVALLVVCALVFSLFGMHKMGDQPYAGQTLHLYLPGEYINDEVVSRFEDQTGASVVMDNFDSNEQMYIKVAEWGKL